jgi:hypothetical protein
MVVQQLMQEGANKGPTELARISMTGHSAFIFVGELGRGAKKFGSGGAPWLQRWLHLPCLHRLHCLQLLPGGLLSGSYGDLIPLIWNLSEAHQLILKKRKKGKGVICIIRQIGSKLKPRKIFDFERFQLNRINSNQDNRHATN